MPINTRQGKAYTLDELIKLGSIGSFGQYNGAVVGALQNAKIHAKKVEEQAAEIQHLKTLLGEAMHDRFISEIKKEQSVAKVEEDKTKKK